MKKIALILGFSLFIGQLIAQEDNSVDPLRKFKSFYELGGSFALTRVNTEHTHFSTSNGDYDFRKNNYSPSSTTTFNFGWLFNDKVSPLIYTLKTGFNMVAQGANLVDDKGNDLHLNTLYLQIPLQIGYRAPIQYAKKGTHFFHAYELNFGVYASTPFFQKLDNKNNLDAEGKNLGANYLKFGFIGEVSFSAFNKNGHGHKFGLRTTYDFKHISKFKKTPYELYPYYYTVGIFYNLINDYYK